MAESIGSRFKHAWSAFLSRDPTRYYAPPPDVGMTTTYRPDRLYYSTSGKEDIVGSLYNRMALDVAMLQFLHVRTDEDGRYKETIFDGLNYCLNDESNVDQTGQAFMQDVILTMFEEGCVAIVPVDTTLNPIKTGGFDVNTLRVGIILEWAPAHIQVRLYDEKTGEKRDIWLPKDMVAIIQNPLYAVMNEPNSTLQRLIRKLQLLDSVDEASSSGKLDIIIQLPYVIRSEARRREADERIRSIEGQLAGSKYGVAYTDGTEKVIQLNRAAENNLLTQIEYLTSMLYSQLGLTDKVFDGTADEAEMLNYYARTIDPLANAVVKEMARKFLTKTARTQKQSIMYFRNAFKIVPVEKMADIADKFIRNAILSANEFRAIIGFKPSSDPKADELRNPNLNEPTDTEPAKGETEDA